MRKVLILTDNKGWHYNQLVNSFNQKNVIVESCNLTDMSISVIKENVQILLNNKVITDITDVFVRHIPTGTLEEVVTNLNILKALQSKGLNVMNTAENIELTVDKSLTSMKLKDNGILTPNTWITRGKANTIKLSKKLLDSHPLIYKPLFGSQGKNIKKISNISDIETIRNDTNVYYLQEFLETSPSHDYRVLVTKSKNKDKTHTMIRYGDSYINNYSKGGKCVETKFDSNLTDIALSAAKILDIPFCGVDIIKYNNKNYVIEVNSIPAWKGLQSVIQDNISDEIVDAFLEIKNIKFATLA